MMGAHVMEQRRTVLITGASRGLGLEIARLFARRGCPLILTARGAAALRSGGATSCGRLTEVVALPGDVADRDHAERLVRRGHRALRADRRADQQRLDDRPEPDAGAGALPARPRWRRSSASTSWRRCT